MSSPAASMNPTARMVAAGLLSWLVPGAGHLFIGDRQRGLIFLVAITLTFWTGVAIGGAKNTVSPVDRTLWFAGQVCAGGHSIAAVAWSRAIANPKESGKYPASLIGYGRTEEVSVVYTAIAGMLNILIILDVLVRAEQTPVAASSRAVRTAGRSG